MSDFRGLERKSEAVLTGKPTLTCKMTNFVSYCRVSTHRQGASGLGLEAQEQAVARYVSQLGGSIVATFVEVESGTSRKRPQLEGALAYCRRHKTTLLIAKLDRLARNVAFIAKLMEADVEFIAVDAPYANRLMLHIMAAFAEFEREQISSRTKAALAAAKRRGVKLGANGTALAARNRAKAVQHAKDMAAALDLAEREGCSSLRDICDFLSKHGYETATGASWHPTTVARLRARLSCN